MKIEDLFVTLLSSATIAHELHLTTHKYSTHKCLNDFYDDMPEKIDALIEHYNGIYGVVDVNLGTDIIDEILTKDPVAYMTELRRITVEGKSMINPDDTELLSDIDDILGLIDSTLYQLKELKEDVSKGILKVSDFLAE